MVAVESKKGVISHETAAALYELGDLLPAKIHLCVPSDFRKKPTKNIVLHKADLRESEIERNGTDFLSRLLSVPFSILRVLIWMTKGYLQ